MQVQQPVVLVVDDHMATVDFLSDLLEQAGYAVVTATDGAAGLMCVEGGGIDLVLLDLLLPDMSGFELCRRVRARERDAYLPIIMLTALTAEAQRHEGFAAGVDDFVTKPFNVHDMLDRVQVWVRTRQRLKAAQAERQEFERRLRQSQRMEAMGQLAGGVAHDFNNVLTAINGFSELLLYQLPPTGPARDYAEEIARAGERAAALTQQILAFSRGQVLQARVVDLNTIVAAMASMLRRLLREDIELVTVLEPALAPVKVDVAQIEQVIVNLVVNAQDAMPHGGTITLTTANAVVETTPARLSPTLRPGAYVTLAVTDTGTGIDAATYARIFEPFFTTKEPGKGTGLGLATVYGIVQQSGGEVVVQTEVGRGSAFSVYLPPVEQGVEVPEAAELPRPGRRGTETIVIAEDDMGVRALAREVLHLHGYLVLDAGRGEEAVRLGRQHPGPIHLLVTDIVMPGLSGRAVGERLRQWHPDLRVLYLSGHVDGAADHGVLAIGSPVLAKPFSPDALVRKVREALDSPRGGYPARHALPARPRSAAPTWLLQDLQVVLHRGNAVTRVQPLDLPADEALQPGLGDRVIAAECEVSGHQQ